MRQGRLESLHRGRGAEVAQKTQDQAVSDPELLLPLAQSAGDAFQYGGEGDTPVGVGLWIEENLNMDHTLLMRLVQIGFRQSVKILSVAQDMWLTLPEDGDERDRMAHTRATFRLIHLADIVAVTTPA